MKRNVDDLILAYAEGNKDMLEIAVKRKVKKTKDPKKSQLQKKVFARNRGKIVKSLQKFWKSAKGKALAKQRGQFVAKIRTAGIDDKERDYKREAELLSLYNQTAGLCLAITRVVGEACYDDKNDGEVLECANWDVMLEFSVSLLRDIHTAFSNQHIDVESLESDFDFIAKAQFKEYPYTVVDHIIGENIDNIIKALKKVGLPGNAIKTDGNKTTGNITVTLSTSKDGVNVTDTLKKFKDYDVVIRADGKGKKAIISLSEHKRNSLIQTYEAVNRITDFGNCLFGAEIEIENQLQNGIPIVKSKFTNKQESDFIVSQIEEYSLYVDSYQIDVDENNNSTDSGYYLISPISVNPVNSDGRSKSNPIIKNANEDAIKNFNSNNKSGIKVVNEEMTLGDLADNNVDLSRILAS